MHPLPAEAAELRCDIVKFTHRQRREVLGFQPVGQAQPDLAVGGETGDRLVPAVSRQAKNLRRN